MTSSRQEFLVGSKYKVSLIRRPQEETIVVTILTVTTVLFCVCLCILCMCSASVSRQIDQHSSQIQIPVFPYSLSTFFSSFSQSLIVSICRMTLCLLVPPEASYCSTDRLKSHSDLMSSVKASLV